MQVAWCCSEMIGLSKKQPAYVCTHICGSEICLQGIRMVYNRHSIAHSEVQKGERVYLLFFSQINEWIHCCVFGHAEWLGGPNSWTGEWNRGPQ